jgi:hypothetical protein
VAVALSVCFNATAAPYSEAPFQEPVFDQERVLVESVGVNNWLNANYRTLSPEQTRGVREHIHALIDSRMREQYAASRSLVPKPDPLLAVLFSRAARLGVYGAEDIFRVVRGSSPLQTSSGPALPPGITVALNGEALDLSSSGKWSVSVPATFFIFDLRTATESQGLTTEAAVIATGTAPDAAPPGYSQATIAVIYTEGSRPSVFSATWLERFGVPQSVLPEGIDGSTFKSRRAYDSTTRLHKEVVFIESSRASMAVLYSGLDGTFQWNRPHFVDFLRNLNVPR